MLPQLRNCSENFTTLDRGLGSGDRFKRIGLGKGLGLGKQDNIIIGKVCFVYNKLIRKA